jgi:hypothetical protein
MQRLLCNLKQFNPAQIVILGGILIMLGAVLMTAYLTQC